MASGAADPHMPTEAGCPATPAGDVGAPDDEMASITVDCLSRKLRASVKVRQFVCGPTFSEHRVQVECAKDLLPLIEETRIRYLRSAGLTEAGADKMEAAEAGADVAGLAGGESAERAHVARWLSQKLQPQFPFPIEVTTESASHHGKILARYAGTDEPARDWQRNYTTFHIDHKQNTASLEEGVQVNVWLNLSDEPVSDFALGFLELGGCMIEGKDLPSLTQQEVDQVMVRYRAKLTKDQALIFQSTGAKSVVHGSFRFQDAEKLTQAPRYSLEFRLLLRRLGSCEDNLGSTT